MKPGRQWIHFDAEFPLDLGHSLLERFGPCGQLLFIQFLCACKRTFPQGEIRYRTEDEARILLGAPYEFADAKGSLWTLEEYWKWLRYRGMVSLSRRSGRRVVAACHWSEWELRGLSSQDAERKSRSRAQSRRTNVQDPPDKSPIEGRGVRGEVGGVRGECEGGGGRGVALLQKLEELKTTKDVELNGDVSRPTCMTCGFVRCECPLKPAEVRDTLRKQGWQRNGTGGTWRPPTR